MIIKPLLILPLLLCMAASAQRIETQKINSAVLGQAREILVYYPAEYDLNKEATFDVVFVFDAQTREMFDYTQSCLRFIRSSGPALVVVGITSPYNAALDYSRNNDMLTKPDNEKSKETYKTYAGNADNFMAYIKLEVIPFVEAHCRVTATRIAVGHSNSAFFLLHTFLKENNMFDAFICLSPNFAYNNEELLKGLQHFNFKALQKEKFIYVSNASEEQSKNWEIWKPARERAYTFLSGAAKTTDKISLVVESFPEENHWSTFAPAVTRGLKDYFAYRATLDDHYSKETYRATIELTVPNETDTVYITGNQPLMGNWNPAAVRMTVKSAFVREITLDLHSPAKFKFTRGSWSNEANVANIEDGANIEVNPAKAKKFSYIVRRWGNN